MGKVITGILLLIISACGQHGAKTSSEIWRQLESSNFKSIDFSVIGDDRWTRVCFLGPHSQQSSFMLEIPWYVYEHTDVLQSDKYNVIIFADTVDVIEFVEHKRSKGDFSALSGICLNRNESMLIKDPASDTNTLKYISPKQSNTDK